MNYYVKTKADREGWLALRSKILEIDGMYENFQLVVMPPEALGVGVSRTDTTNDKAKKQETKGEKGLFGRPFGGRT